MKLRCCIITTVHSPFDVRIFHKQARTLVKAGYEVILIAPHSMCETVDGVKIIPLPRSYSRIFRMLCTITALRLAFRQKANIYHFHDPELIYVGLILKLFRKKVIYDVHEDYPPDILIKEWIPTILRRPISVFANIMEKISTRIFDGVVGATDNISRRFLFNTKRVVSIRNYPVVSDFGSTRKNYTLSSDNINLIYAGGIAKNRGATEMVKALEYIHKPNVKLKLAGKFYPSSYEQELRNLKGFEKVEYLGWIDYKEIPKKLIEADIGLLCLHPVDNYKADLGIKFFEYLLAGLPIIASNFPLWKEVIEDNKCGICVNPLNTQEIAGAIEYLIEHPEVRRQMGENGRKSALEKYKWEKDGARLVKLYEQILRDNN